MDTRRKRQLQLITSSVLSTALAFTLALPLSCQKRVAGVLLPGGPPFPERLSEWGLLAPIRGGLAPLSGGLIYDLNTPLFTDYAEKFRTIWMPPGSVAGYRESGPLDLPENTIISKTFSYGPRRIETRLLMRTNDGWNALAYVWNESQSDADLELAGRTVPVNSASLSFEYFVPSASQCRGCHIIFQRAKDITPLGVQAAHMNRTYDYPEGKENQLSRMARIGYLEGLPRGGTGEGMPGEGMLVHTADAPARVPRTPVWNDPSTGSLEARALAYLDVNCAHCHNEQGPARTSGLVLDLGGWQSDRRGHGLCKPPVAAGRGSGNLAYDIVPGKPEQSILIYRLVSTDPGIMMPEIGRTLSHKEGVDLLSSWIARMNGSCL